MNTRRIGAGELLAEIVVHEGIAYLSGATSETPEFEDTAEQTRKTLATIDQWLSEAGTDKTRLLSAQIWLVDLEDFEVMNAIWIDWLGDGPRPARACVQADLAGPHYKVEIMVTAAVP
jgi:enamine deaminase RidA (YjgF/YER057c/UK114 family)